MHSADYWIEYLELIPHPEGGYYREIYRSDEQISQSGLPARYPGGRSTATLIYYLLEGEDFSALHRLRSDEIWSHLGGCSIHIHKIYPGGKYEIDRLGTNPEKGYLPVSIIKRGIWFGATLAEPDSWSLVCCMVTPGFDFEDFEIGERKDLLSLFPEHSQIITELTHESREES